MHTELPAKQEKPKESLAGHLKEAITKLRPKDYTTKSFEELREKELLFLREVRRAVNPEFKDLTVVYPACGGDIETPLLATGAKMLILIDMSDNSQNIIWNMKKMGIESKNSSSENRTEIEFEWEGRSRRVLFYKLTIEPNALEKLPAEMKEGYDIYFEKKQIGIGHPRIQEEFIKLLKAGGFRISDKEVESNLGFRNIPLGNEFESCVYDGVRLFVQQKNQQRPAIEKLMDFNEIFADAEKDRHGGYSGIDERWAGQTLSNYFSTLMRLRIAFDELPPELRAEVKPKILEQLYEAPGDMSKVHHSPEHWQKLFESRKARGRTPPENEVIGFQANIRNAKDSSHRPTQEQLDEYIEKGREIFRNIWGPEFVK